MPASTIIVQYRDGSPARHKRVTLGFLSGISKDAYTDSSGRATIEHSSVGWANVYINGEWKDTFRLPGKCAVTI